MREEDTVRHFFFPRHKVNISQACWLTARCRDSELRNALRNSPSCKKQRSPQVLLSQTNCTTTERVWEGGNSSPPPKKNQIFCFWNTESALGRGRKPWGSADQRAGREDSAANREHLYTRYNPQSLLITPNSPAADKHSRLDHAPNSAPATPPWALI